MTSDDRRNALQWANEAAMRNSDPHALKTENVLARAKAYFEFLTEGQFPSGAVTHEFYEVPDAQTLQDAAQMAARATIVGARAMHENTQS